VKQPESDNRHNQTNFVFLVVFGIAFGFVEAAVVYYLRDLINFHSKYAITNYTVLLNLGFITFITPIHSLLISHSITVIETARETATIVMLIAVAFIAGKDRRQRIGAFLVSFACWDIMYYGFLKVLDNWPASLVTKDIYFLIPVTWIGPVITPLVMSAIMLIIGSVLYLRPSAKLIS
jgi:hypothetical protein